MGGESHQGGRIMKSFSGKVNPATGEGIGQEQDRGMSHTEGRTGVQFPATLSMSGIWN